MATSKLPPTAQAYLKEARRIWDESQSLPDDDTLRELAIDAEMTPEESQACEDLALELIDTAKAALKSRSPDNAIEPLKSAILLAPLRLEPHYLLARFYADRYRKLNDAEDHARAEDIASRCEDLAPLDKKVKKLLYDLTDVPGQNKKSWKQAILISFILVLISGTISVCARLTMIPEPPEGAIEEVRQYFEEQQPPP